MGTPQAVTCAQTPGHQEWEPTPALEPARIVTFPHPHITPSHFTLDLNQGIAQDTRRFQELPGGTLGLQSKSIHQDVSATRSSNKGKRAKGTFRGGFNSPSLT